MIRGIMLISAWILIQHHCCAVTQNEKPRTSFLIDQLSRRSNLEKNFMRFGRSSPESKPIAPFEDGGEQFSRIADTKRAAQERSSRDADFMRFGRAPLESEDIGVSERSGRSSDFMRFGRSDSEGEMKGGIETRAGRGSDFMRFGRKASEQRGNRDFMRFGRSENQDWSRYRNTVLLRFGRANGERATRAKENFMRFGKSLPTPLEPSSFVLGPELALLLSLSPSQPSTTSANHQLRLG